MTGTHLRDKVDTQTPNSLSCHETNQSRSFNRTDVKEAMHAPMDVDWAECAGPVFLGEGKHPNQLIDQAV
jgi:hypothetical protein